MKLSYDDLQFIIYLLKKDLFNKFPLQNKNNLNIHISLPEWLEPDEWLESYINDKDFIDKEISIFKILCSELDNSLKTLAYHDAMSKDEKILLLRRKNLTI